MLSNEQITAIIDKCKSKGYSVRVRDISYVILCMHFEDKEVAYKSIFGDSSKFVEYDSSIAIEELKKIVDGILGRKYEDITFDENKAEIIKLIQETKDKEANGELDAKQSLDLQTKLRVALNDKFGAKEEEVKEQLIVVNMKYNSVCEYCGHELYIPTKEDLMKEYNLIEK